MQRREKKKRREILRVLPWMLTLGFAGGCRGPERVEGVEVFEPSHEEVAGGPVLKQSRFQVYWIFEPQIQRQDFNGVFSIHPEEVRLVSRFWNQKFVELTRAGYYDDFFMLFYEYMASFAQSHPTESRRKELILDRLEKRFQFFCSSKGIEDEFLEFQARMLDILGN